MLYSIESTVQFLESGKGGCPHPHNEVIIDEAVAAWILFVQFIGLGLDGGLVVPAGRKQWMWLRKMIYPPFSLP